MERYELTCKKCGANLPEKWDCADCGMTYVGCFDCGAEFPATLKECPSCKSENLSHIPVEQTPLIVEAFPDFPPVVEYVAAMRDKEREDEPAPQEEDGAQPDLAQGLTNLINDAITPRGQTSTDISLESFQNQPLLRHIDPSAGIPAPIPGMETIRMPAPDSPMVAMHGSPASGMELALKDFFGGGAPAAPIYTSASDQPVWLSMETGQSIRSGQQGILNLRMQAAGIDRLVRFELECQSNVLPAPHVQQGDIEPGEAIELDPVVFIPERAGQFPFKLILTFSDRKGVPLARWMAKCVLSVEESQSSISYNVQGDFIIGALERGALPGLDTDSGMGTDWNTLRLQKDNQFDRRIRKLCPALATSVPQVPADVTQSPASCHGVVALAQQWRQLRVAVHVGQTAVFGRGEMPDVNFPLSPEPFDPRQHGRLSRAHIQLDFSNGRLWLTTIGSNYTRLNGEEVPRRRRVLVADGDELSLAGVVDFRMRLYALGNAVTGVWLWRQDAHVQRLAYACLLPATPLPCVMDDDDPFDEACAWLSWSASASGQPAVYINSGGGTDWSTLAAGGFALPTGARLTWRSMPSGTQHMAGYRDQTQYLQ